MVNNDELQIEYLSVLDPYETALRDTMNVPPGWIYRPVGWMRNDFFDMFIDIIGDENMMFVSQSTKRFDNGEMYTRASLFVSPTGIVNINTYLSLKEDDASTASI